MLRELRRPLEQRGTTRYEAVARYTLPLAWVRRGYCTLAEDGASVVDSNHRQESAALYIGGQDPVHLPSTNW